MVEARTYCHATEDCNKVARALSKVVDGEITMERIRGHHGNEITVMAARIEGCDATTALIKILKSLDDIEFNILINSINIYKNRIFIRLNKQKALRGVLRIDEGDDVIHIEARLTHNAANRLIETLKGLRGSSRGDQEEPKGGRGLGG
ncbi:MAG: RNA-binding domain-containing protein [Thermoproteus sp.]